MKTKLRTGINTTRRNWDWVFPQCVRDAYREILDFDDSRIADEEDPAVVAGSLRGAEVVISSWNAVPYTKELLDLCPDLKIILYAAGSVKYFATDELVRRKIPVTSSALMNAVPVAEFVLGLILTSLKNVVAHHADFLARGRAAWEIDRPGYNGGYYKTKVGLIGDGLVVRRLLDLLRPFDMDVLIDSKYFTPRDEETFRARRTGLDELMSVCDVVSVHHADIPENWNMINRRVLGLMKKGARFINTSRGRMVNEADLVEKLRTGDITAFLDVTHPEPPEEGHPFYSLPNCVLTPHLAGSIGRETERMSMFCLDELKRFLAGEPLRGIVDFSTLNARA
jgi:phosphoglycerate dehydrogenase-like enzyme